MGRLPYFYLHTAARNDRKLAKLSDAEHRVWFSLLCFAAEQDQRGTIPPMPLETLALECANDLPALLTATLARLKAFGILIDAADGGLRFEGFERRNPIRATDSPTYFRDKKREQRERDKARGIERSKPVKVDMFDKRRSNAPVGKTTSNDAEIRQMSNMSNMSKTGVGHVKNDPPKKGQLSNISAADIPSNGAEISADVKDVKHVKTGEESIGYDTVTHVTGKNPVAHATGTLRARAEDAYKNAPDKSKKIAVVASLFRDVTGQEPDYGRIGRMLNAAKSGGRMIQAVMQAGNSGNITDDAHDYVQAILNGARSPEDRARNSDGSRRAVL